MLSSLSNYYLFSAPEGVVSHSLVDFFVGYSVDSVVDNLCCYLVSDIVEKFGECCCFVLGCYVDRCADSLSSLPADSVVDVAVAYRYLGCWILDDASYGMLIVLGIDLDVWLYHILQLT